MCRFTLSLVSGIHMCCCGATGTLKRHGQVWGGALKDHAFIRQYEVLINSSGNAITILDDLPPGTYEREEVAARSAMLDAEVADLKKTSARK
jgi:hypothetical protein